MTSDVLYRTEATKNSTIVASYENINHKKAKVATPDTTSASFRNFKAV